MSQAVRMRAKMRAEIQNEMHC